MLQNTRVTAFTVSELLSKNQQGWGLVGVKLPAPPTQIRVNTLTNVPTSLNNLKTKVDELDVGKLKTFPVDLNKLSDVVDNEVVKNTKFNTLKIKVNSLENSCCNYFSSHKSIQHR